VLPRQAHGGEFANFIDRHVYLCSLLWNGRICSSPFANHVLPAGDTYIYIYLQMCVGVCLGIFITW